MKYLFIVKRKKENFQNSPSNQPIYERWPSKKSNGEPLKGGEWDSDTGRCCPPFRVLTRDSVICFLAPSRPRPYSLLIPQSRHRPDPAAYFPESPPPTTATPSVFMTSAAELFYTRRSRAGRDPPDPATASANRNPIHPHGFQHRHHQHRHGRHEDDAEPLRRGSSFHARHLCHRVSQSVRPPSLLSFASNICISLR